MSSLDRNAARYERRKRLKAIEDGARGRALTTDEARKVEQLRAAIAMPRDSDEQLAGDSESLPSDESWLSQVLAAEAQRQAELVRVFMLRGRADEHTDDATTEGSDDG